MEDPGSGYEDFHTDPDPRSLSTLTFTFDRVCLNCWPLLISSSRVPSKMCSVWMIAIRSRNVIFSFPAKNIKLAASLHSPNQNKLKLVQLGFQRHNKAVIPVSTSPIYSFRAISSTLYRENWPFFKNFHGKLTFLNGIPDNWYDRYSAETLIISQTNGLQRICF